MNNKNDTSYDNYNNLNSCTNVMHDPHQVIRFDNSNNMNKRNNKKGNNHKHNNPTENNTKNTGKMK